MAANRILWIDFCRVYTAFCVIVRHCDRYVESPAFFMDLFNYRSLIFFFFLVSGYLTHRAEPGQCLDWKRARRLLWPYLFWAAFAVVTMMPMLYWPQIQAGDWSWATPFLFLQEMGLTSWTYWSLSNVPLWFLRTLFLLALVSPLLQRLSAKTMGVLILACFAGSDVLCHADVEAATANGREGVAWLPFRLYESVLALGFFAGGLLLRRHVDAERLTAWVRRGAWWPPLASLVLLPAVYFWRFSPPIQSSALVLLGVLTTMSIGCLCERYLPRFFRYVASWGSAAFFVYVTHYLALKCVRVCLTGDYRGSLTLAQASVAPFAILAFCLALWALLRRLFPRFMRLLALS